MSLNLFQYWSNHFGRSKSDGVSIDSHFPEMLLWEEGDKMVVGSNGFNNLLFYGYFIRFDESGESFIMISTDNWNGVNSFINRVIEYPNTNKKRWKILTTNSAVKELYAFYRISPIEMKQPHLYKVKSTILTEYDPPRSMIENTDTSVFRRSQYLIRNASFCDRIKNDILTGNNNNRFEQIALEAKRLWSNKYGEEELKEFDVKLKKGSL